jgi:putative ABC transport system permease protein
VIEFLRDLRYAGRGLRKSPAAAGAAIFALALGIGVNATSFTSVNSLVFHPFPFPRLDRILTISETTPQAGSELALLAPANYLDFTRVAAYRLEDGVVSGSAAPVPVRVCRSTPGFFPILGVRAALGTWPSVEADTTSAAPVAIVSDAFWKSYFGAAAESFKGSTKPTLVIDGRRYDVLGVMPDEFDFPLGTQVWLPLRLESQAEADRTGHNLGVIGLLRSGMPSSGEKSSAQAEAAAIAARLAAQYPATNKGRGLRVVAMRDGTDDVTTRFLEILLCAASFVLILACANVANLQLARTANRQREIVVRSAIGAGRLQIARGLLAEGLWIAIIACPIGLFLASWNLDRGRIFISPAAMRVVPGLRTMHLDYRVVVYSFIVSLLAGVVCSLPAIVQFLRHNKAVDWGEALRERAGGSSFRIHGMRSVLIVSELASLAGSAGGRRIDGQHFQPSAPRGPGFQSA